MGDQMAIILEGLEVGRLRMGVAVSIGDRMNTNLSAHDVFAKFLAWLAVESPEAHALLRTAEPAVDEWEAADDGSYRAGMELLLVTETDAAYDALEGIERLDERLRVAGRAAGLAFIRIDGPSKGFRVVETSP